MIGNHLEPFKFWCQKVLPNVYDDSLSYYEYLCKLNEYLNGVIGQINTLTDNMEDYEADLTATWLETKSYIDNYFNNLDVQQEINNKLDQMASSGELSTLLAPIVGTQIGGVVANQIGDTVASQIGNTVASQIDEVVAEQIGEPTANATANWLNEHVDPVGSAVIVDDTLTISGAAADAEVTGVEIVNCNNDLSEFIENGYTSMRPKYVHGKIAGAPGTIFNNAYVWRATTGIKFNNSGSAIIKVPSNSGVSVWRCSTSDVETGTKNIVGTYYQDTTISVSTDYWYVLCAFVDADPDGSNHQTLSKTKLYQITLMYIDESGYVETRLDGHDNDIKVINYKLKNLNNDITTPYIEFVHGRIAGTGSFYNNPYSYRSNNGIYFSKGDLLHFSFDANNVLRMYIYEDANHTTYLGAFLPNADHKINFYEIKIAGYYYFCIENKDNQGSVMVSDTELANFKLIAYKNDNMLITSVYDKYGTPFIEEENTLINSVGLLKNKNTLVFALCTDVHGTNYPYDYELPSGATPSGSKGYYRYKEFADSFVKIAEENGVDFMSNLGDTIAVVSDESSERNHTENKIRFNEFSRKISNTQIPYLYTIGHHEMFKFSDDGNTKNELLGMASKYNRNFVAHYNENDNDCAYYYVDLESPYPSVRIISLDVCSDGTGNAYSLAQVGWLQNVALNTTKPVIVLSHMGTTADNSAMAIAHGDDVETILNAFVSNGGKVLAFIHGHTHCDNIITPGVSGNSYVDITTVCAWAHKNAISPLLIGEPKVWDREYFKYNEYAIDIYCIDCVTGIIYIKRFGAGESRQYIPN